MNKRKKRPKAVEHCPQRHPQSYRYAHLAVINLLSVLNSSTLKDDNMALYYEMKDAVVKWNLIFCQAYAKYHLHEYDGLSFKADN